jgi:fumarylpyruvate hydrolase
MPARFLTGLNTLSASDRSLNRNSLEMNTNLIFETETAPVLNVSGADRLCPVHRIYCVGQNYAAHAREMGGSGREAPFFFSKPAGAVTQASTVSYPSCTANLHHEIELVVVIGKGGKNIPVDFAPEHVFGYAAGVDLTRRDLQAVAKEKRRPWDVAKGFDESAPISQIFPVSITGHPSSGKIQLSVNGEIRQQGDLTDMIWTVPEIIAELSRFFNLKPGDLIFTGTPDGVGAIEPGSTIECGIEGIGTHRFSMENITV